MSLRVFGAVCLFALVASAAVEMPDVPELTDASFAPTLKEKTNMFVMFFAPWCGHCKRLAPTFNKLAVELKGSKDVYVAKVDCTAQSETCKKYGVRGYPTLKHFSGDKVTPYEGDRSPADLHNFLKKIAAPAYVELKTVADVEKFVGANKPAVLGLFQDQKSAAGFISAAEELKFDVYNFAVVVGDAKAVAEKYKVGDATAFVVGDEVRPFAGEFAKAKFVTFLKRAKLPLFGQLSQQTYRTYMETGLPFGTFVVKKGKEFDALKPVVEGVVAKHRGVAFCFMYDTDGIHKYFNLPDTFPGFAINKNSDESFYLFKGKFTAEELDAFTAAFEAGKLTPSIKSEPVPKNDKPNEVYTVVGTTLEEVVNDPTRDVLVKFYATWCGHCKKLAPAYKKVAEHFANDARFRIAEINVPENTVPKKYGVQGFPTIIMFRAGDKKPQRYNGDRTYEDLVKFVLGGKEDLSKADKKKEL